LEDTKIFPYSAMENLWMIRPEKELSNFLKDLYYYYYYYYSLNTKQVYVEIINIQ
jgi:hypothetical protein